jgi:cell division septum initiation protein DivIVA
MRTRRLLALWLLVGLVVVQPPHASAQLKDLLKSIGEALKGRELSESTIIRGLKEALRIGTGNAVEMVSQVDGYFDNPQTRIPLPESVQNVEEILRAVGFGPKVAAFERSMNRAAERAAPEAKSLFLEAIRQMTFSDAKEILQGQDDEATRYFEGKTRERLHELFKPIVHTAMSEVGVTRSYQELEAKVRRIPFAESLSFDLDEYVTDKGLDGLFFMVAEEERKIRQDPAARVTDLLEEVFGRT